MIDYTKELKNQLEELNRLLEEADNRLKKSWKRINYVTNDVST